MVYDPDNPRRSQAEPASKSVSEEGEPVAVPLPPIDGKKPVPPGSDQVERFNVATDTEGGD